MAALLPERSACRVEEATVALTAQYYTAMAAGYGAARALDALYADDAVCRPPHAHARLCDNVVTRQPASECKHPLVADHASAVRARKDAEVL